MVSNEIWGPVKELWSVKRWKASEYHYLVTKFKKEKMISNHPKIDGLYDFVGVRLKKSRLPNLIIEDANFDYAQAYYATLRGIKVNNTSFLGADFCSADLAFGQFNNCSFQNAWLKRANLYKTEFVECDFTGCTLSNADVSNADFINCTFDLAKADSLKKIEECSFLGGSFRDIKIDKSALEKISNKELVKILTNSANIITHPYQVALSFAGEDRAYVEKIANGLKKAEIEVFYDKFETAALWGKDQLDYLHKIYRYDARYCMMFISKYYLEKAYPQFEKMVSTQRQFLDNIVGKQDYILPVIVDDTMITDYLGSLGYIRATQYSVKEIVNFVREKLDMI